MGSGAFFTTDTFAEAEGWIGWSCATSSAGHMKATVPDLSLSVWLSQAANALPGKQNTANMIKPVRFTPMLLRLVQGDAATRKNARRPRLCTAELAPICGNLQIKANTDPRQPVLGRPGTAHRYTARHRFDRLEPAGPHLRQRGGFEAGSGDKKDFKFAGAVHGARIRSIVMQRIVSLTGQPSLTHPIPTFSRQRVRTGPANSSGHDEVRIGQHLSGSQLGDLDSGGTSNTVAVEKQAACIGLIDNAVRLCFGLSCRIRSECPCL